MMMKENTMMLEAIRMLKGTGTIAVVMSKLMILKILIMKRNAMNLLREMMFLCVHHRIAPSMMMMIVMFPCVHHHIAPSMMMIVVFPCVHHHIAPSMMMIVMFLCVHHHIAPSVMILIKTIMIILYHKKVANCVEFSLV